MALSPADVIAVVAAAKRASDDVPLTRTDRHLLGKTAAGRRLLAVWARRQSTTSLVPLITQRLHRPMAPRPPRRRRVDRGGLSSNDSEEPEPEPPDQPGGASWVPGLYAYTGGGWQLIRPYEPRLRHLWKGEGGSA